MATSDNVEAGAPGESLETTSTLLQRWLNGDDQAASEVFSRYVGRLVWYIRDRLSTKYSRRFDAEDVAQSAFQSLFRGVGQGQYVIRPDQELWPLLVTIALNKLRNSVRHHRTHGRDVAKEIHGDTHSQGGFDMVGTMATILRADDGIGFVDFADELENLLARFQPDRRKILEMLLTGSSVEEIASEMKLSDRQIRRILKEKIQPALEQWQARSEDKENAVNRQSRP